MIYILMKDESDDKQDTSGSIIQQSHNKDDVPDVNEASWRFKEGERPKLMDRAVELYADAYTMTEIAKMIGVERTTLFYWKKKYPEFGQRIDEARRISGDFYLRCLRDSANEGNPKSIALGLHYTNVMDNVQKHELSGEIGLNTIVRFVDSKQDEEEEDVSQDEIRTKLDEIRKRHNC